MVTLNRTIQSLALPINDSRLSPHPAAEASPPNISPSQFPHLSQAVAALHEIKHSIFSSLYSSVGSGLCARPVLEFFDQEICTQSFALQLGIAVAAGIPAGFAGRAAGQGLIAFVGNNALGRVAAFCIRIPVTHLVNQYLSGNIQAYLSHQSYSSNSFSAQDLLSMGNLGAAEVLGHALGGSTGSFILGRLIGGATNCVATGLEIFAGHQINKVSRQILHRNLFEAVEQREVWRDALNWRELVKNSVTDAAFCVGHGMFAVGSHLLRRVGPPCPTANGDGRPQRAAPTVESPSCQDFIEFAGRIPEIWHQTQLQTLMLAMGAVGRGARSRPSMTSELEGLRADLEHACNRLRDAEGRGDATTDQGAFREVIYYLQQKISAIEKAGIQEIGKSNPIASLVNMVYVQGGRFRMGAEGNEGTAQEITLPDFEMSETVVTNSVLDQYRAAMQERPFAVIATQAESPYCWVIARFATEVEAKTFVGRGSENTIGEMLESESFGNDIREQDFFRGRKFVQGLFDPKTNLNGLQIVEAVPKKYKSGENFDRPNQPAVEINWFEALGCADWLGRILKGLPGRLPTAAESELVRRGGIDPQTKQCRNNKYGTSDGKAPDGSNADFNRRYDEGPKDVDATLVNRLGIRINGVWEWCNGWYRTSLKGLSETIAGFLNPEFGSRELRGVSWNYDGGGNAGAASRSFNLPDIRTNFFGFRVVVAAVSENSNF
ncbi:MAG: SUMF1/EgtB/PvdO family nonheme iron enzyme [Deltaproteobacteria bacterium]|nr:SUMF1/EgtB/PvdO family nonheme iron enzyme [Deltaproteobacteria bacterium]